MLGSDRRVVWLAGGALALAGCGAKATSTPAPTATALDATPAGPTHEALDVPVVLACHGPEFSGNAAPDIVWTGTELLVTRAINGELYLSRIGRDGELRSSTRIPNHGRYQLDDQRSRVPGRWHDGKFQTLMDAREPSLVAAAMGTAAGPWEVTPLRTRGSGQLIAYAGAFVDDGVALTKFAQVGEGTFNSSVEFVRRGGHVVVDPGCSSIHQILATSWGVAVVCVNPTQWANESPTAGRDYRRTIIGIKDDRIAWRFDGTDPELWDVVIGTDGANVLVVQASRTKADAERHPDQLRVLRLDSDGRLIGQPFMTTGRLGAVPPYRMVWTGKEYALAEDYSFTRFDSEGRSLGTWSYEPDCGRDNEDAMLVWMGDAYALCSWHYTVYRPEDAEYPAYCAEINGLLPRYPTLRVAPDVPAPSEPTAP